MRSRGANVPAAFEVDAVVDAVTSRWPCVSCYELTHDRGVHSEDVDAIADVIKEHDLGCTVAECVKALERHVADKMAELAEDDDPPDSVDVAVVVELSINEVMVGDDAYWCPRDGGHVYLVTDERPGALGEQVCDGLEPRGSTLICRGERLLATILRELPEHDGLVIVERLSHAGPRLRWQGDVSTEQLEDVEADLVCEGVDWSNTITLRPNGEQVAPIVTTRRGRR